MIDLAVMRLADMTRVHPRQDNSRVCAKCGEQVGIYPSGQDVLRHCRDVRIVCVQCLGHAFPTPGAEREPFESVPAWKGRRWNHALIWLLMAVVFAVFAVLTEVTQWAG
jgi:hypothetical protein